MLYESLSNLFRNLRDRYQLNAFFYKNVFGLHQSLLWGHWYSCFGLLVTFLLRKTHLGHWRIVIVVVSAKQIFVSTQMTGSSPLWSFPVICYKITNLTICQTPNMLILWLIKQIRYVTKIWFKKVYFKLQKKHHESWFMFKQGNGESADSAPRKKY